MDDRQNAGTGAMAAAADPVDNSHLPPAERAAANGYKDPEPPTRDERIMTVVADLEHAIRHNAPVTLAMLAEIKDLLGVQGDGIVAQGGPADPNVRPDPVTSDPVV